MRQIVRERILDRDGRKCNRCGNTESLEIDHVIPLSKGGRHNENNFQVLCKSCNRKKSNKIDMRKYIKTGVSPDYILVSIEIEELIPYIGPEEFTRVMEQFLLSDTCRDG